LHSSLSDQESRLICSINHLSAIVEYTLSFVADVAPRTGKIFLKEEKIQNTKLYITI